MHPSGTTEYSIGRKRSQLKGKFCKGFLFIFEYVAGNGGRREGSGAGFGGGLGGQWRCETPSNLLRNHIIFRFSGMAAVPHISAAVGDSGDDPGPSHGGLGLENPAL